MALVEGVQLRIKIDGDKVAVKSLKRVKKAQEEVEAQVRDVDSSSSEMSKTLGDEVAPAADKASDSTDKMGSTMRSGAQSVKAMAVRLAGVVAALGLGQQALQQTIGRALQFDRVLIDVQQKAGLTTEQANELGDALLDLAAKTAVPQEQLAGIAATAGQLGIEGTENILTFTETTALFAEATELSSEEASQALATIGNAFQLPIDQSENLASAINTLANTTAASARPIVTGLERIGGAGESVGFTVDQVAALTATLVDSGVEAATAGTALRNVFVRMQTEADRLGAAVGVTGSEFNRMVEDDALGALNQYLSALRDMPTALQAVEIRETFGQENFLAVQTLTSQTENLSVNLDRAAESFEAGTAVTEEFETGIDRTSRQLEIFTARLTSAATAVGGGFVEAIGSVLRPLNRLTEGADETADRIRRLGDEQERLRNLQGLVDRYEELAGVTRRSSEQTEELREITQRLRSEFPGFVSSVQDAEGSFRVYSDALRGVINARATGLFQEQQDAAQGIASEFEEAVRITSQYERAQRLLQQALGATTEEQFALAQQALEIGPGFSSIAQTISGGDEGDIRGALQRLGQSSQEAGQQLQSTAGALNDIFTVSGELQVKELQQLFDAVSDSPRSLEFAFSDFLEGFGEGTTVTFGDGEDVEVDTSPLTQMPPVPIPARVEPTDEIIPVDDIDQNAILDAGLLDTIGEMELRILRIKRAQQGGLLTDAEADQRRVRAAEQALQRLQQQAEQGRDVDPADVRRARQVATSGVEDETSDAFAQGIARGARQGINTGFRPLLSNMENDVAQAIIQGITQALASAAATKLAQIISGDKDEDQNIGRSLLGSVAGTVLGGVAGLFFDKGGYTGDGKRMEPAGIVHRGEYVIPKPVVDRTGPDFWARMAGMPGYDTGGFVRPVQQSSGGSDALMREVRGLADEVARIKQQPAPALITRSNQREITDGATRVRRRRRNRPPTPNKS